MSLVSGNIVVTTDKIADGAVTAVKLADDYVNVTGDTMTGDLYISNSSLPAMRIFNSTASSVGLRLSSQAGASALLDVLDNTGTYSASAIAFDSTGTSSFLKNPLSSATQSTATTALTRKDYVDDNFTNVQKITADAANRWFKVAEIRGGSALSGGSVNFNIVGDGDYSQTNKTTLICNVSQRGIDVIEGNIFQIGDSTDFGQVGYVAIDDFDFDVYFEAAAFSYPTIEHGYKLFGTTWVFDPAVDVGEPGGIVYFTPDKIATETYVDSHSAAQNVIINGNFDVWQRGTSFVAIAPNKFNADRFEYRRNSTAAHTVGRSTDVPTVAQSGTKSNYSVLYDVTTADVTVEAADFCFMSYDVEGYDYARIAGGDATLSFWVKAAKTGIHCVMFKNVGFNRTYVKEYTIATADTWEKVTLIFPLTETGGTWDYTNGVGLEIGFILMAGSTFQTTADAWQTGNYVATANQVNEVDSTANNFRIAQVQLEKGSTATPFEYKSIADELAKCQRYYWRGETSDDAGHRYGLASDTLMLAGTVAFPTTMRSPPTAATITAPVYTNCSSATIIVNLANGMALRVTVTANGRYRSVDGIYEADAEL